MVAAAVERLLKLAPSLHSLELLLLFLVLLFLLCRHEVVPNRFSRATRSGSAVTQGGFDEALAREQLDVFNLDMAEFAAGSVERGGKRASVVDDRVEARVL
jgi:hypothetical protein